MAYAMLVALSYTLNFYSSGGLGQAEEHLYTASEVVRLLLSLEHRRRLGW